MDKNKIVENKGPKYSEMLIKMVEEFESLLPEELTFEDTLDVGIDAWNLANRKDFLENKDLYKQELKSYKYKLSIEKMVNYKLEHFLENNNMIVNYEITDDILNVMTQTQEEFFNNLINQVLMQKPEDNQ